jgi:CBS domain-containing protein
MTERELDRRTLGEEARRAIPGLCRDVMTNDPVCCSPSHTVDVVAQLMTSVDVGPVPIAMVIEEISQPDELRLE